jgi:hypothetical protein
MPERGAREFYVGWQGRMPPGLARSVRARLICLGAVILVVAAGLVAAQQPFARAVHEFGRPGSFEGWIAEHPYPMLRVERPGDVGARGGVSSYLLTARGKHGAAGLVRGLDGARVRLAGTLIYRGGATMLELPDAPLERLAGSDPAPAAHVEDLGQRTLSGEIVDSKCFLGVMRPGERKIHRACAARCLSGGVPPLFVLRGVSGEIALLLSSASGEPAERAALIEHVAEPIRIRGRVRRVDDWLVLSADSSSYERLE